VVTVFGRPGRGASQHPPNKYDIQCKLFLQTTAVIPTENVWCNLCNKQEMWGEWTRITIVSVPVYFSYLQCAVFEIVRCVAFGEEGVDCR